ncbi:tape measure protein [Elizabethkingia anophelis]|uniref:tape measure protein n=1 Tax=Elizabethkingia anophelis TaxID=1117645 RepID=UPI00162ABFAF|nr:tape measure protein [Elizabethkingia anophelis]MCT4321784.1 tape measure protein [Elizabethkingia anophelis]
MNNSQGALYFGAGIDMTQWRNSINEMRQDIFGLNNTVQKEAGKIDSTFKNLSIGIAGYFSANALKGFAMELINVRGEFQKTEIAFTTMLGNGGQAKQLMNQMVDLAAKTPFSLQDVSSGAKQLLAFQVPASEVVDTLTRMGNIAAGLSIPLSRINLVYGQVKAKGKLMGDDLRQFTEAGIPMVAELAKKFNKTTAEISAMVTAGKIGFNDVKDVLFAMTNEGGMFFNLMEQQSASLSGKISNLEDAWDQMLNKIGEANQGLLSDAIDELAWMVEHYEKVISAIEVLVLMYGAYKAALIVNSVALQVAAASEGTLTVAQGARTLATIAADKATQALNATMFANPYAVATALIVGLIAALVKMSNQLSYAEEAQAKLNKRLTEATANTEEQKSKIESLIVAIKSENITNEKREVLLNQIKKLADGRLDQLTVEKIKTGEATEAINEYVKALDRQAKAKAYVDLKAENYKRIAEIDARNGHTIGEAVSAVFDKNSWTDKNGKVSSASLWRGFSQDFETQIKENEQREKNALIDQNKALDKQINDNADVLADAYSKGIAKVQGAVTGYVEGLEAKLDELKEAFKKAPTAAAAAKIAQEMDRVRKKIDALKPKNGSGKQIAEILPLGSIKELERRRKLLRDALDSESGDSIRIRRVDQYGQERDKKGNPYYTGEVVSRQKAGEMLAKIDDEINKKQTKSFEERLNEAKRQIEVRDKLIQQGYSKDYVDGMFPDVKDTSFLEYLDKLSERLAKTNGKEAAENLIKVRDITTEYTGEKTFIDNVNQQIEKLKSKFSGNELVEKLENLKKANLEGTTENNRNEKNKLLNKAQEDERMRIEANYNQLLNDHKTFEEKKAKITKDLNDALSLAKNDSEREKIKKAYGEQLSALTVEAFRASKDWAIAFGELEFVTRSTLQRILQQLIAFRLANKDNLSVQDYKVVSDKINEIQSKLNISNPLKSIISSYKEYKEASEDLKKKQEILKQANLDLAESYELLNKAQSGEEFNEADRKRVEALKKRKKATEDVQNAEFKLSENQVRLLNSLNSVSEYFNNVRSAISSVRGIFDDLGISMDNAFGDILDNLEQTMQGFEQMQKGLANAFQGFASGNIVQGIAGGLQAIGGLIKSVSGWFNNDKKKERAIKREAEALKELKSAYEDLAYAANKALGSDKYDAEKRSLQNIRDQQARLREMYRIEGDKKKSDSGKMDEYKEQIKSLDRQYQDLVDSIAKDFLQTDAKDMASQLTDGLVEALSKGESALDSLDKKTNDVFANMAKAWVRSRLEKSMGDIFDKMLSESGVNKDGTGTFNPLSSDRMNYYKELMKNAGLEQQKFLEQYKEFFQDANSSPKGLEGAVKSITSEEAGELVAQMNAIRINQGKMLEMQDKSSAVMRESLIQLSKIEFNTSRLHNIDKNMADLNSKITNNNGSRGSGL